MDDPPILRKPQRYSLLAQIPAKHRASDEFLIHLTPSDALEALNATTGALGLCLASASSIERDFAQRTATASRKIWEWTNELSGWQWPADSSHAGFESPRGAFKGAFDQMSADFTAGTAYIGSLPAQQIELYQRRIDEISVDVDMLEIEDIKAHVITDHITPLSRPNTPSSTFREHGQLGSICSRLEDISAMVTAIVVQTLPLLAKLTRLLRIWEIRLAVLQLVPSLLYAFEDAEVGVKAGWNAISNPLKKPVQINGRNAPLQGCSLERDDFDVMKAVLVRKVATPGHILDQMLDHLEGLADTLPDAWLDRMEAIEHMYSDWVGACEKGFREIDWAKSAKAGNPLGPNADDIKKVEPEFSESGESPSNLQGAADPLFASLRYDGGEHSRLQTTRTAESSEGDLRAPAPDGVVTAITAPSPLDAGKHLEIPFNPRPSENQLVTGLSVAGASPSFDFTDSVREPDNFPASDNRPQDDEDSNYGDTDLPVMRSIVRRSSNASSNSVLLDGDTSRFEVSSGDIPEVSESPPLLRAHLRDGFSIHRSPPSSPPLVFVRDDSQELPASPLESPTATTASKESDEMTHGQSPMEESFADDFDDTLSVSEWAGSTSRRESTSDVQLRQQISEIIESIPARIKLSTEPSSVSLNPPDLQLPRLRAKSSSKEAMRRSASGLSSRTATPSFTLSPARGSRTRQRKGQQDIKVYHLSRSTGEPPIKLFIRCVGEHGERVMVRVGGGWADLSEYLKEYASHHGRRSLGADQAAKVEIQDAPLRINTSRVLSTASSPQSRSASAAAWASDRSPGSPLHVRKARRSIGAGNTESTRPSPQTPAAMHPAADAPSPRESKHSSPNSSRLTWMDDDSSFLGLAGPTGKRVEMSEENKAWVEGVKEKVRMVSGERRMSQSDERSRFGDMGKVGGTKRLYRKAADTTSQYKR